MQPMENPTTTHPDNNDVHLETALQRCLKGNVVRSRSGKFVMCLRALFVTSENINVSYAGNTSLHS